MVNEYKNNWEETIEEIMFHVDTFEIGVIDRDECQSVIEEILAKYAWTFKINDTNYIRFSSDNIINK